MVIDDPVALLVITQVKLSQARTPGRKSNHQVQAIGLLYAYEAFKLIELVAFVEKDRQISKVLRVKPHNFQTEKKVTANFRCIIDNLPLVVTAT